MALMHPGGARRPPGAPRLALLARTWPAELAMSTALGRCGVEGRAQAVALAVETRGSPLTVGDAEPRGPGGTDGHHLGSPAGRAALGACRVTPYPKGTSKRLLAKGPRVRLLGWLFWNS